jgi:hypothetical protein
VSRGARCRLWPGVVWLPKESGNSVAPKECSEKSPTLAKSARMGHPTSKNCNENQLLLVGQKPASVVSPTIPGVALDPTSIILSLHQNDFSNAHDPNAVRNRCGTPAIPWRASQNRSSNTQLYKNLVTRPNILVRSLVIYSSNPAKPSGPESSSRVWRAGSTSAASAFFRAPYPSSFAPLQWCARGCLLVLQPFF